MLPPWLEAACAASSRQMLLVRVGMPTVDGVREPPTDHRRKRQNHCCDVPEGQGAWTLNAQESTRYLFRVFFGCTGPLMQQLMRTAAHARHTYEWQEEGRGAEPAGDHEHNHNALRFGCDEHTKDFVVGAWDLRCRTVCRRDTDQLR
jgi:hypothetical protein